MVRHGIGAGILVACSLAGCGGQVVRDPPDDWVGSSDDSNRLPSVDPPPVEGLCVSARWTDPTRPVAIGFALDVGFTLLRADGSHEVVVRSPQTYNTVSWASIDRERYFAARLVWNTNHETRIRGMTFTRTGSPTWELDEAFPGVSQRQTFRMSPWGATLVSDSGTHVILPSGEREFVPGFMARTPANPFGWVLGFTDEETGAQGWTRLGEQEVRPTQLPLVPPSDPSASPTQNAHLHVFTLVYLGRNDQELEIVVEQAPSFVRRYPTGTATTDTVLLEQVSSDVYLLHVDGVPRFAFTVSTDHFTPLDLPTEVSERDEFAASETHLVVVRDGRPTWRANLFDGTSAAFTDSVGTDPGAIVEYLCEGRYVAAKGRSAPLWVADASTGSVWIPGTELGPTTMFGTSSCGSESTLLEDGTTAFGVRGSETGRVVVSETSGDTHPLGVEHSQFNGFPLIDRIGQTWVYTTRALEDCAPSEPWLPTDTSLGEELVAGAAAVVVPPDGAPLIFPDAAVAPVHESGWCTFNDGIVYDLGTREEHGFDTSSLRWLDETF